LQSNYHQNEDIQRLSDSEVLQRIPGLVRKDGDVGGIEVLGFTINHQQLSFYSINYLKGKVVFVFNGQPPT